MELTEDDKLLMIAKAIRSAGFNVHDQLTGYLEGNEMYITRKDNARGLIATLNKNRIRAFVVSLQNGNAS